MKADKKPINSLSYFNRIAQLYDTKIIKGSIGLKHIDTLEVDYLLSVFPVSQRNMILDVGAGTGRISEKIGKNNATVLALDLSPEMLSIARKKISKSKKKVDFVLASAENIPFKNETFDKIISVRVIHYVNNWRDALSEISRVVTRKGLILISANSSISLSIFAKLLGFMRGNVFNPFYFAEELRNHGFIQLQLKSYIHIPIFFYAMSKNIFMLNVIKILDNIFGILTKKLFGVRFYVLARKT